MHLLFDQQLLTNPMTFFMVNLIYRFIQTNLSFQKANQALMNSFYLFLPSLSLGFNHFKKLINQLFDP